MDLKLLLGLQNEYLRAGIVVVNLYPVSYAVIAKEQSCVVLLPAATEWAGSAEDGGKIQNTIEPGLERSSLRLWGLGSRTAVLPESMMAWMES